MNSENFAPSPLKSIFMMNLLLLNKDLYPKPKILATTIMRVMSRLFNKKIHKLKHKTRKQILIAENRMKSLPKVKLTQKKSKIKLLSLESLINQLIFSNF